MVHQFLAHGFPPSMSRFAFVCCHQHVRWLVFCRSIVVDSLMYTIAWCVSYHFLSELLQFEDARTTHLDVGSIEVATKEQLHRLGVLNMDSQSSSVTEAAVERSKEVVVFMAEFLW